MQLIFVLFYDAEVSARGEKHGSIISKRKT